MKKKYHKAIRETLPILSSCTSRSSLGQRLLASIAALLLSASPALMADDTRHPPEHPAQSDPGRPEVHRVVPGDTLWGIAERYFDNPFEWYFLQQANTINEPTLLQPDTVVDLALKDAFPLSVLYLYGDAWRVEEGEKVLLEQGVVVNEGDTLETGRGASLTLEMSDGARAVVPSNSRVMVHRDGERGIRLTLEAGGVESQVPSRHNKSRPYNIETRSGVLGVRGTRFSVSYADDATLSSVYEGRVAVQDQQLGERAQVSAGQGTRVSRDGDIDVVGLLMPPDILDAEPLAGGDLAVRVRSMRLADGYQAQLTRDAQALDLVAEQRSSDPQFTFSSVPSGDYYLRVAAVGYEGIVGNYAQLPVQHVMEGVSVSREGEIWRFNWTRQAEISYTLELAVDAAFEKVLISYPPVTTGVLNVRNVPQGRVFWRVVRLDAQGNVASVIDSGRLDDSGQ
ncbi:FecR domain-containing protein [Halomonas sp. LS-001]